MKFSIKTTTLELKALGLAVDHDQPHLSFVVENSKLKEKHREYHKHRKALRPIADELLAISGRHRQAFDLARWAEFFRSATLKGEQIALRTLVRFVIPVAAFDNKEKPSPIYFFWGTAGTGVPGVDTISGMEHKTLLPESFSQEMLQHIQKLHTRYQIEQEAKPEPRPPAPHNRRGRPRREFGSTAILPSVLWGTLSLSGGERAEAVQQED